MKNENKFNVAIFCNWFLYLYFLKKKNDSL